MSERGPSGSRTPAVSEDRSSAAASPSSRDKCGGRTRAPPPISTLEVSPFVVIGEARSREAGPRRQSPTTPPVRGARAAILVPEPHRQGLVSQVDERCHHSRLELVVVRCPSQPIASFFVGRPPPQPVMQENDNYGDHREQLGRIIVSHDFYGMGIPKAD